MSKIKKIFKRSSFFYSIFVPFVAVGVILIVSFGIFIYQRTYKSIQDNLVTDRQTYVNQVKENIEQKVRTVEFAFTTYSSTTNFKEMINEPLDYHKFRYVWNINSELAYIGVMGTNNATYSLISLSQGWEINNGSLNQLSTQEIENLKSYFDDQNRYIYWQPNEDSLEMMILLPTFSTERSAIGIANISEQSLMDIVQDGDNDFLAIYTKNDELIYSNHTDKLSEKVRKDIANSKTNQGTVHDESGNSYIYSKSDYNQWIYTSQLSKEKTRSAVIDLEIGLTIILLVLLIFYVVISFIVAKNASKPIRKLRMIFPNDSNQNGRSEVDQILEDIDEIIESNTNMSLKIEKQKPELENLFVLNLFKGQITKEEIPNKMEQLGYEVKINQKYIVLLIQLDNVSEREKKSKDIFLLAIENLVSELISSDRRLLPIILNQDTQATILSLNENIQKRDIIEYCDNIQQAANEYLKVKISLGISNFYSELSETRFASDNAKEALHYRDKLGKNSIIFYDEISSQLDEKSVIKYPKLEEQQLLDAIRSGDKENVNNYYRTTFELIVSENTNPITIENGILRLINSVIQLGQLLGADYDVLQKGREMYSVVLQKDNLKEIEDTLCDNLVIPILETIQGATNRELKKISDKMIIAVHQQYDQDINLDTIGDQLHYSPNYLSNVFKNETGQTFSEYLQNYRLSIAKKWLVESNITIREISERLQYNNPQNFIRFFKKIEGITPGEYRKKKQ